MSNQIVGVSAVPLESRAEVVAGLLEGLADIGIDYAVRGLAGSPQPWIVGDTVDLDLWTFRANRDSVLALMFSQGFLPLDGINDARPNHLRLVTVRTDPPAIVEWLFGDLSAGPVPVWPEQSIAYQSGGSLLGPSLAVDVVPRRMMLGKPPTAEHLAAAGTVWSGLTEAARGEAMTRLDRTLGDQTSRLIGELLAGTRQDVEHITRRVRQRARRLALQRRGPALIWHRLRRRMTFGPSIDGRRMRGQLVALIGTDGTGKSTTTTYLAFHLDRLGVEAAVKYFGRTRGNLPGVSWFRRRLEASDPASHTGGPRSEPKKYLRLRKAASWYYAIEYAGRFWITVWPLLLTGRTVILDRFVYDLAVMPRGSVRAAQFARVIVRSPDIVLLLDAPADEIHRRKPERTVAQIEQRQRVFADLLGEVSVRVGRGVVRTSSDNPSDLRWIAAAIAAAGMRGYVADDVVVESVEALVSGVTS